MNVFYLSSDPVEAAIFLVDKHAKNGKMAVEACQLLQNCFTDEDLKLHAPLTAKGLPRKREFISHPCSIWVRQSSSNYDWLIKHAFAILEERSFRCGSGHFSKRFIEWADCNRPDFANSAFTTPALAIKDFPDLGDAITSYRYYYSIDKQHLFQWTKRPVPYWI